MSTRTLSYSQLTKELQKLHAIAPRAPIVVDTESFNPLNGKYQPIFGLKLETIEIEREVPSPDGNGTLVPKKSTQTVITIAGS